MLQVLARLLRHKRYSISAAVLLIYALLGFLLIPYLVQRYAPVYAQEYLQRQVSLGEVYVNPFLFKIEIQDFNLQETDGQPIATAQHLLVDFETSSLLRWAWTFADIRITGLDLNWSVDKAGRSNLSRLADDFPASEAPTDDAAAPTRLLLQHIQLSDGILNYSDQSLTTPASTRLAPINIELEDLSTLPERQSPYALIATLPEGGRLVWRGEISLQPLASDGELYINGFKPIALWAFLQDRLNLATPEGVLELYTRYNVAYVEGETQFGLQNIYFNATGLNLSETGQKASLLKLDSFAARGGSLDLSRHEIIFPKVAVRKGQLAATLLKDGSLNWQRLVKATPAGSAPPTKVETKSAAPEPWQIRLDALHFEDLGLKLTKLSQAQPVTLSIGRLGAHTQLATSLGTATSVSLDDLGVQLADVALTQSGQTDPLAALAGLDLNGVRIDTQTREVHAQQLSLRGGSTHFNIDPQGKLALLDALTTGSQTTTQPESASTNSPWHVQLAKLQAKDFDLDYTDQRYQPALRYDLEKLAATVENLSNAGTQPTQFEADAQITQGGKLNISGTYTAAENRAEASINADQISLQPLKSLIEHYTTLTLQSGTASTQTQLSYTQDKSSPALHISGAANIDKLLLDETLSGDRFLAWDSLATKDLDFSLSPDRLTIKQLRLVRPGAKILIFKDRSVNLGKIMKPASTATAAKSEKSATGADETRFPISIERVRVEKGDVDFADLSLVLPFSARIEDLNGTISGIASAANSRTNLKLEGRVDEYGSVQVDGGLSPFAAKQYTDIRTRFRNVELTPFSAYTATFAGRKIASGKLSLDLEYKVKDSELVSDNTIVLDHFTLGERVDSPDALDLPLDLAIALLTDSQGRINTAIPVRGNVDSPTFSYGKLVGQAIAGMIGKIVTAPFRALGSLLGGSSEKLDSVSFDPGSAKLLPPQIETLKKIGEALQKRPQLGLTVSGRYDPKLDSAALRSERVRRELAESLNIKLDADEEPPAPAVDQAKTQRALEKLLEARAGDKATDSFQATFEKTAGRTAEPVNPALALLGKASPDAEYYQAMFEHLVQLQPLDDADLKALAQQRADTIVQTLATEAGLTEQRASIGKIETTKGSPDQSVDSKLILKADTIPTPTTAPVAAPAPGQ